jgi:hypothetical protein
MPLRSDVLALATQYLESPAISVPVPTEIGVVNGPDGYMGLAGRNDVAALWAEVILGRPALADALNLITLQIQRIIQR